MDDGAKGRQWELCRLYLFSYWTSTVRVQSHRERQDFGLIVSYFRVSTQRLRLQTCLEAVLKDPLATLSFDRICNKSILHPTAVGVSDFQPRRSPMESPKPTRSKEPSSNGSCYDLVLEMEHRR